jgi:NAD(P)-dependent dehydrogenase (short-subunit alcohol dehydrogenase family)
VEIKKQVVIVTGGAQGIGYGIANVFAKQGAVVVLADTNEQEAIEAAKQLIAAGAFDPMLWALPAT